MDQHDDVRIRAAQPTDAEGIALVHVRSWQGAYRGLLPDAYLDGLDPAQRTPAWDQFLSEDSGWPGSLTLVVDAGQTIVGFASVGPARDDDTDAATVGELGAIYLLPTEWGAGTGRALMGVALAALATSAGATEVVLWVLDGNGRARRFYEAGGWAPDGATKEAEAWGVSVSEVRYRRRLDPDDLLR